MILGGFKCTGNSKFATNKKQNKKQLLFLKRSRQTQISLDIFTWKKDKVLQMRLYTEVSHGYTHAKRSHTLVKDPVLHIRVWSKMRNTKILQHALKVSLSLYGKKRKKN